jgi:hypothetical protein
MREQGVLVGRGLFAAGEALSLYLDASLVGPCGFGGEALRFGLIALHTRLLDEHRKRIAAATA